MQLLRQSTGVTLKIGPFLDETDGKTDETGLTITQAEVRLSKNGGNYAQKNESTSCTPDELGEYNCPVDTTDTNTLGRLKLIVHESGALPVWHEYLVITQNAWDSLCSTDYLKTDLTQIAGAAVNTSSAQLGVNLVNIAASAVNTSSAQIGTNLITVEGGDASDALDACATATGFSTHAAADIWSHASGVTILADVAAIDALTEGSGAGDLAAMKTNVDAIDTLTEASGNGDLAAIKTAADAILVDTGTDGVVVAAASKTGYVLAATGLDSVATTEPSGMASNYREMMVAVWWKLYRKSTQTATEEKTYDDNDADVKTTQPLSDAAGTQTRGTGT